MRAGTLRRRHSLDIWPGFVDALTSLILVMIFLLLLFVIGQSVLSEALSTKNENLISLRKLLGDQARELSMLRDSGAELEKKLEAQTLEANTLRASETALRIRAQDLETQHLALAEEKQQLIALKDQGDRDLEAFRVRMDGLMSDLRSRDERIGALDQQLKLVSEARLTELEQYRSDFFGKLKQALQDRGDLRINGDRFILPSDVLFQSGSATLEPKAAARLEQIAVTLKDIEKKIPSKINWVIRVDGHTDKTPIQSAEFPSNWELSSARAIALVKFLVSRGVDPHHLSANGLGPYHPIDPGEGPEALAKNRRIELQLTNP